MNNVEKICVDCGRFFKDPWNAQTKCELCKDRDYGYQQEAAREKYESQREDTHDEE